MKQCVLFLFITFLLTTFANADTIRNAKVLNMDEIEGLASILEPRVTAISEEQMKILEASLTGKCDEGVKDILKTLVKVDIDKIPVMELSTVFGELPIADAFRDHSDPVVRFIANIYILKAGRLDAAERLHALIDDDALSEFDSRYLKSRFVAIGIDVESATSASIAKHFASLAREFPVLAIGDSVPNFQFTDSNGREISIESLRGKTVIIHYWATWCSPCVAELDALCKQLNLLDKDDFVIVFSSLDFNLDSHAKYIERLPNGFHYTCDGKSASSPIASTFGVINLPRNIVISPDGKLAASSLSGILPKDSSTKSNSDSEENGKISYNRIVACGRSRYLQAMEFENKATLRRS